MFTILAERTIHKPIEEVFALLSDHEDYSQFKGIDASRLVNEGTYDKNDVSAVREVNVGKGRCMNQLFVLKTLHVPPKVTKMLF